MKPVLTSNPLILHAPWCPACPAPSCAVLPPNTAATLEISHATNIPKCLPTLRLGRAAWRIMLERCARAIVLLLALCWRYTAFDAAKSDCLLARVILCLECAGLVL